MPRILHIAAFWAEDDQVEKVAELLAPLRADHTAGACVSFKTEVARQSHFLRTMDRLSLQPEVESGL